MQRVYSAKGIARVACGEATDDLSQGCPRKVFDRDRVISICFFYWEIISFGKYGSMRRAVWHALRGTLHRAQDVWDSLLTRKGRG